MLTNYNYPVSISLSHPKTRGDNMNIPKSKKSQYNYIVKTFTYDGIRYKVRGATEEEAIKKKLKKLEELEAGRITSNSTVKQWAETWLETYVKPRGLIDASYRMYEDTMNNAILPAIGNYKMNKVTALQLQKILNSRTGMSFSHASKLRIVLKAMFRQAWLNRIIPFDVSADLQMPKTTKGKHRSLTAAERDALLKFADSPVLYDGKPNTSGDWVLCILYCGLRPGETAALKWSEVDLDAGTMHIRAAKESASKREKAPKTDAGIRDIPIPKVYAYRLKMRKRTGEYVFPQSDGKTAMTDSSMRRRWETIKKHIDIEMGATVERVKLDGSRKCTTIITEHTSADDLDLYDLRHTYCTDLEKKGVPINIAKYLMGHSDISVTANIYTHADNETIETARTLIDG